MTKRDRTGENAKRMEKLKLSPEKFEEFKKYQAAAAKRYAQENPEKARAGYIKRTYGLSWEKYCSMFEDQKGGCAICRAPIFLFNTGSDRAAYVDHSHVTGKVRGLLCANCNTGIGQLQDNATICRLAAEYLEIHQENDYN